MRAASLLVLLLTPTPAMAAADTPHLGSILLQTGWALLVVVGLILALYGLTKKRFFLAKSGGNAIKIVEMRPLLPKATLALVEVRGKEMLLGISGDRIQLLSHELPQPVANNPQFAELLKEQQ